MPVIEELKPYYESVLKFYEETKKTSLHIYQRIDTLTTVISTSSIFLLATVMTSTDGEKYKVWGFYLSIIIFAVAIIFNLLNHLVSNIAHSKALDVFHKLKEDLEDGKDVREPKYYADHQTKEKFILRLNHVVKTINFVSVISLIIGIVLSVLTFLLV